MTMPRTCITVTCIFRRFYAKAYIFYFFFHFFPHAIHIFLCFLHSFHFPFFHFPFFHFFLHFNLLQLTVFNYYNMQSILPFSPFFKLSPSHHLLNFFLILSSGLCIISSPSIFMTILFFSILNIVPFLNTRIFLFFESITMLFKVSSTMIPFVFS